MTRFILIITLALVGGALIGGFAIVGGPQQARIERDDRDRARHLREWGHFYTCTLDPAEATVQRCPNPRQPTDSVDPETSAPYQMTRIGPNEFRVCATFEGRGLAENPSIERQNLQFDGQEGCLHYRREADNQAWILQ